MPSNESIRYQRDFPPEEFRGRWDRIFDRIGEAMAVLQGAPLTDGFSMPRQYSEFYYLCGVETPHSYLLLDGRSRKTTLYLPPRNPRLESAEGKVLSAEDADLACEWTGADAVCSTTVMTDDWLGKLEGGPPKTVFALFSPPELNCQARHELNAAHASSAADHWDGRLPRHARFIELIRTRYPRASVQDLTPILDAMRAVKSPREVALIREASRIAGLAMIEAIRSTRPGLYEYHLDAAARYMFLTNGCRLEAYRSIAASGTANINNMHYFRNDCPLEDGALVLLDYAPEYRYYASDITRMWPVSGRFNAWQRELLQFVLEYRNAIMTRVRPGVTAAKIKSEAAEAMEAVFAKTQFSKPCYEAGARCLVETSGGAFSHPVGLAVHDDGRYDDGPLKPGHVFSIDPQLRVPEENLYLRYEDLVVVTETGYENFTDFLPAELDEIEALMLEPGVVQKVPPVHQMSRTL